MTHIAAIIMNEHLTEALRRLKKDSNENSVDRFVPPHDSIPSSSPLLAEDVTILRQLVSNVLISFLNTPRADTKRFEMLQLISSILSWSDDQREQVGLQRSSGLLSAPGINSTGSRPGKGHARSGKGKGVDDGLGESEVRPVPPTSITIGFVTHSRSSELRSTLGRIPPERVQCRRRVQRPSSTPPRLDLFLPLRPQLPRLHFRPSLSLVLLKRPPTDSLPSPCVPHRVDCVNEEAELWKPHVRVKLDDAYCPAEHQGGGGRCGRVRLRFSSLRGVVFWNVNWM